MDDNLFLNNSTISTFVFTPESGDIEIRKEVDAYNLIFILKGDLECVCTASAPYALQNIASGHIFFLMPGEYFYAKASQAVTLVFYSFNRQIIYNNLPFKKMERLVPTQTCNKIQTLKLLSPIFKEIETTIHILNICKLNERIIYNKVVCMLLLLEPLYSLEELADLFSPILCNDPSFKESVLRVLPKVQRAQDFPSLLHLSPSSFKRKFKDTFQMAVGEWLLIYKKRCILYDIQHSAMNIQELAEKYNYSQNYFMSFCKEHFNCTINELREQSTYV